MVGEDRAERSVLDAFFVQQDGATFKATVAYEPYFYVVLAGRAAAAGAGAGGADPEAEKAVEREAVTCLERKFEGLISSISVVEMEDLGMDNHLCGANRRLLRLAFRSVSELSSVRRPLQQLKDRNVRRAAAGESLAAEAAATGDPLCLIVDMREYDVPYITRVSIDCGVRVGKWYTVTPLGVAASQGSRGCVAVKEMDKDFLGVPEPRILAWDIECTKAPLKFPDARTDHVYMISYMLDGRGVLLINREVVTEDVQDFEYTPAPEYPGPFVVYNYANEEGVMRAFIEQVKAARPQIFVTFNGDYFDWPFVHARCKQYDIDMPRELGVGPKGGGIGRVVDDSVGAADVEWRGRTAVHIDWCV